MRVYCWGGVAWDEWVLVGGSEVGVEVKGNGRLSYAQRFVGAVFASMPVI